MLVDLSMPLCAGTPVYPGDPAFRFQTVRTVAEDGCLVRELGFSSHFGTHVDAPSHTIEGGRTLNVTPLELLVGEACILDLRGLARIGAHDLPDSLPANRVLLHTGHSMAWMDPDWLGSHPVLEADAARKLRDLGARLVGMDTFSLDDSPWPVHEILLAEGVLLVENLVGLEQLPERFRLIVAPLRLLGADGAPARVLAEF
ncbi:MAG: cyclase family protein [Candidatus Delongbacteria bacterium]|nr:cyclase family protein [Candidatus Cloacimonadota bacterium]MCB9473527.1 cyclase family protein [Candidatus Delongbacteria bacterium]